MLRLWPKTVVVLMLLSVAAWGLPQQAPPKGKPDRKVAKKPAATKKVAKQPEPPPAPPPPPPTPENSPAQVPQVSMNNGMLSISSQNSTLGDILTAVRRQTGAALELAPGASQERVAVRIGPAAPKDAVSSLLEGSRFNYIILGSARRPGMIDRIILTPKQNLPAGGQQQAMGGNNPQLRRPGQPVEQQSEDAETEEGAPETEAEEPAEVEQPAAEEQTPAQQNQPYQPVPVPNGQQPDQNQQQQGQQQNPGQPHIKTPEELLRELQQMRNQQNPQQNPQPGQPPQQQEPPQ